MPESGQNAAITAAEVGENAGRAVAVREKRDGSAYDPLGGWIEGRQFRTARIVMEEMRDVVVGSMRDARSESGRVCAARCGRC